MVLVRVLQFPDGICLPVCTFWQWKRKRGQKQQAYMRHDELLRLTNLVTALVHKDRKKKTKQVSKNRELPE